MSMWQLLFYVLMCSPLAEPAELFSCKFESDSDSCGMEEVTDEKAVYWGATRESASGPPGQPSIRGPIYDVTTRNGTGYYKFAVSAESGSLATLAIPEFRLTATEACFSFWYVFSQYARVAEATVKLQTADRNTQVVWKAGNAVLDYQSLLWTRASISVEPIQPQPLKLFFSVDMNSLDATLALDDLLLTEGPCSPEVNGSFSCSFDDGELCGMQQPSLVDDFDWSWVQGSTFTPNTGPKHTSGPGESYVYTEADRMQSEYQRTAVLETPTITPLFPRYCLSYDYHMWGSDIGSLDVLIADSDGQRSLSSVSGNQGNSWHTAIIDFDAPSDFKMAFIGSLGLNNLGDIALDNVDVSPFECQGIDNFTESFEAKQGSILITLRSDYSFTIKTSSAGRHMAVDAPRPVVKNSTARLASPWLLLDAGNDSCLTFNYLLLDSQKALLQVGLTDFRMEGSLTWLWMAGTNTGPQSQKVQVNVPAQDTAGVRIIFEAFAEDGGTFGDLHIDDVQMHPNACIQQESSTSPSPLSAAPPGVIISTSPTVPIAATKPHPTPTTVTPTTPTPTHATTTAATTTRVPIPILTTTLTTTPSPTTTTTTTTAGRSTTTSLKATTSKLEPPRLSLRFRRQGASRLFQHAGRLYPFTYAEIFFQLNIPNSGGYMEMKLERCVLQSAGGLATVVHNGCAWHPAGVMMFDGHKPGTEVLYVRVFKPPASALNYILRCNVRLCKVTDFTCFIRPACINKRHARAAAYVRSFQRAPVPDDSSSRLDSSTDRSLGSVNRDSFNRLKPGVGKALTLDQVTTSSELHDGNLIDVTLSFS